jgi:hypothetical protein
MLIIINVRTTNTCRLHNALFLLLLRVAAVCCEGLKTVPYGVASYRVRLFKQTQFTHCREKPAIVYTLSPTWLFVNACSVVSLHVSLCNYVTLLDNVPYVPKHVADYRHLEVTQ